MKSHVALLRIVVALVPGLGAAASRQHAVAPTEFVIRRGKDTVAIERFTRDGATLSGEISQATGIKTEYLMTLRSDHSVEHLEMSRQGRQGPPAIVSVDFGDTVRVAVSSGGESGTESFAPPNRALPFFAVSFAISEQIVRATHLPVGQSAKYVFVRLGVGDTASATVTRFHRDSVSLSMPDVEITLALSPAGDVVGARHSKQGWTLERKGAVIKP
jgi:hypothetical protein